MVKSGAGGNGAFTFIADGGQRTGILTMDINEPLDIPRIAEPWFLALNAGGEATPATVPEAAPAIEQAVKRFG
jgi:hypothetical protein